MADTPKVVPIGAKNDMRAAIEGLRRMLPDMLQHAELIAQVKRSYYQALVKEGFTPEQALELTKHSIAL